MVGAIGRRLPVSAVSSSCGLSFLLHGLLAVAVVYGPQWLHGKPFIAPLNYEVTLISPAEENRELRRGAALPAQPKVATAAISVPAGSRELLTLPSLSRTTSPKAQTDELTLSAKRRAPTRLPVAPPLTTPGPPKIVAPLVASVPVGAQPGIMSPVVDPAKAGAGRDPGTVAETGVTVGNTDPALAYYFVLIQDKITSNWMPPKMSPGAMAGVSVSLRILRSGQIRNLAVGSSSGDRLLDDSAVRAISLSSPLPPLPPLYKAEALSLELRFTFVGEKS
ncbi:MAG: TonB family protein [Candidatus Methylomirabilis oxygeniifera]|nr:MAG: TonB family protein [Candidatus Methylomirabilis oxyfera]